MSKLIFLVLLCRVPSAFVSAQDSGTDEYVTGMTVVGTPGAGPQNTFTPPVLGKWRKCRDNPWFPLIYHCLSEA
jgi:hypothetical protein